MKKYLLSLLALVLVLLSGCAMADMEPECEEDNPDCVINDPQDEVDYNSYLRYNYRTLSFVTDSPVDILFGTGNPSEEYKLLSDLVEGYNPDTEYLEAYSLVLDSAETIQISTNDELGTIVTTYSSKQFNTKAEYVSIELTASDLIAHNYLKSDIEGIKTSLNGGTVYISKTEYIEKRLDIDLTVEDVNSLKHLQYLFNQLAKHDITYRIDIGSVEDFMEKVHQYLEPQNIDETAMINRAFEIIKQLHDD